MINTYNESHETAQEERIAYVTLVLYCSNTQALFKC